MKTTNFVKLAKQILPHFPGFVVKGKILFMSPVEKTLRGFHFEPSAFSDEDFYVNVFFLPFCVPVKEVHYTFGHRVGQRWKVNEPNLLRELTHRMLKEAPYVAHLMTPDDVAVALEPFAKRRNPHSLEAYAYTLVQSGQLRKASVVLEDLGDVLDKTVDWQHEIASRAQLIRDHLAADGKEATEQLKIWEAETASELGF